MIQKSRYRQVLSLILSLCILVGVLPGISGLARASTPTLSFGDLDGFEWADPAISALKNAGIVNGTSPTTFAPSDTVPRAGFAKVLCSAFSLRDSEYTYAPSSFSDVGTSSYSALNKYIEAAKAYFCNSDSNGDGNAANEFNPGGSLTREEIVYALVNVLGLDTNEYSTVVSQANAALKYSADWSAVGATYKPAVALATAMGFVSGDGNGSFNPADPVNRAEMAVLLYRALMAGGGIGSGNVFDDIKPGDWYYTAVMNLYNRGIISGSDTDGNGIPEFSPDTAVTNAALKGMLNKIYGSAVSASMLPDGFVSNETSATRETVLYAYAKMRNLIIPADVSTVLSCYTDQANITYRDQVAAATEAGIRGIYNASGELVFEPSGSVSRAQLAVLIEKTLPASGSGANVAGQVFSDVSPSDWYYDGVMNLYNRRIVIGYEDGTFMPDSAVGDSLVWLIAKKAGKVTASSTLDSLKADSDVAACFPGTFTASREVCAYSLLKANKVDFSGINADDILAQFKDSGDISAACRPAIAYLVSIGVMNGDNGYLKPGDPVSRGELAVFYAALLNGLDQTKMHDYEQIIKTVKGCVQK